MNIWQRAFLSVSRKIWKSLILFFLLLIVSTVILVGLSIKHSADKAALEIRHSLGGSIDLVVDKTNSDNFIAGETGMQYIGSTLDDSVIEAAMETSGIESYNAYRNGESQISTLSNFPIELIKTNNQYDDDEVLLHTVTNEANTFSAESDFFKNETFALSAGRHIQDKDENVALISKELADLNQIEIGNQIKITSPEKDKSAVLTIVGLFEIMEPQLSAGLAPPPSLYQNRVFIDMVSAREIYGDSGFGYQRIRFTVNDPAELTNIAAQLKENSSIPWDDFAIETSEAKYRQTAAPLETMSSLMISLLLCVVLGSVIALSLILNLFMRNRIHETGIFLAMGFTKIQIFCQHIIEMCYLAGVAYGISFFLGNAFANEAGTVLLKNISKSAEAGAVQQAASDLTIAINRLDFALVCGLVTFVILLSVGVSCLSVFRMKPKNILSQMS